MSAPVTETCACGCALADHDGTKGGCRVCRRDPERAPCMAYRPAVKEATARQRTPIAPMSEERRRVNAERLRLQLAAWGPKPWTCALKDRVGTLLGVETRESVEAGKDGRCALVMVTVPACRGQVHGHEKLSRARAGRTNENLLDIAEQAPLCNRHNGWLTQFRSVPGWVKRSPPPVRELPDG